MQQHNPNSFNFNNKSGWTYEKSNCYQQFQVTRSEKIDKICHFRPFSKIPKMKTQGTSLKLPTLRETRNNTKSGKRIENSTLLSTFFGVWRSFTPPIILRLKIHGSSDRYPVQIWQHKKRINKEKA